MADNAIPEAAKEEGTWHTVEQAAVALGLSVRTVNRHIQTGKLRSRLRDARREVFVPQPSPDPSSSATPEPVTDSTAKADGQEPSAPSATPLSDAFQQPQNQTTSDTSATQASVGGQSAQPFATPLPFDVESALARADNAADKAELAVVAYQNLARSIEAQAQSARRGAKVAWSIVAVLVVAAGGAIWWTATNVTEAKMKAAELERAAQAANKSAEDNSAELQQLRARLSTAEQAAAHAQGRVEALEQIQSKSPTTAPSPIDRLLSAFNGPPSPDH